jgi:hypothetical protein
MRDFVNHRIGGPDFARAFLDLRRESMDRGERAHGVLCEALNATFYAIDDYAIDPTLRSEEDLTDEKLRAATEAALSACQ